MKIAIRVDASIQIGTGHFMRCLTLANELKRRGAEVCFLCRCLPEQLRRMLEENDHKFLLLDQVQNNPILDEGDYAQWLGVSQQQDATDSVQALSSESWDWLIVDHYALNSDWEAALRQSAKKILVIDDLADRPHDCDVLLDSNFYSNMNSRYKDKLPSHCQLLLGPRYALLRDDFRLLHNKVQIRKAQVSRVLVFFGGVDAGNLTSRVVESLASSGSRGWHVDVVIGAQHPARQKVEDICAEGGFYCHVQTKRMPELMSHADLAIGAGGLTLWERCCLGLPTLAVCTADNQRQQIADAACEGLLYAPELEGDFIASIGLHIRALVENNYLRQAISHAGMQAVDGRGVLRVVRSLDCCDIEIRLATKSDSNKLLEWRNHPSIRTVSRSSTVISSDDHQKWFADVQSSSDKILLIGQSEDLPVGVVRFDIQGNDASVSIYLVPGIDHPMSGGELLQCAECWLSENRPEVNKIVAIVLGVNERSQHLFLNAGYQFESACYMKRMC